MSKPPFDPSKPFQSAKPAFDPSKPFDSGDQPPQQEQSFGEALGSSLSRIANQPKEIAQNMTPEKMSPHLPLAGLAFGSFGGPLGMATGAGLGQIGARMADLGYGRVQPGEAMDPLTESIAPMAQTALGGLPETSFVSKIGKGLAKAGQTISGAKQDVLEQATRQGYSTYAAPSMEKAQKIFGEAIGPEGRAAMKSTADQAFDPALGQARTIGKEIGAKIENGETVTALEALKARQATDRVISATPFWDRKARGSLYDWRSKFDDIISSLSGPIKQASDIYRKSIVKDQLLNVGRINKHGEPSALLPMLAGLGGPMLGYQSGHTGKGTLGAAAYIAGTSPLAWGLGATTLGAINPNVRRALITELISRVTTKDQGGQKQP